jgi:hypothetical protein
MPRKKQYADKAEKQRAYRRRKCLERVEKTLAEMHRLNFCHQKIAFEAEHNEDQLAARLLGRSCIQTAMNLASHFGESVLDYAHEHEREFMNCDKIESGHLQ